MDLEKVFAQVEQHTAIEYRDPLLAPYGNESKNTITQTKAWQFLLEHEGEGPLISMLGAKGSAKTHFGAAYATRMAQIYPNSMGLLIANTTDQLKQILPIFFKVIKNLNIPVEYFNTKKVHGEPYSKVIVVDLDGTGFDGGKVSYLLVRSFEATDNLEGFEPDWMWIEEVQDTTMDKFRIVFSRVRGTNGDNSIYVAGMPEDSEHWQYSYLPKLGFAPEADWMLEHMPNYDGASHETETAEESFEGIMYWPKLEENTQNNGAKYLERMKKSHSGALAQRYIYGLPVKTSGNKVFYEYRGFQHKMGRMSHMLSDYDETLPIIVSVDFNVAPMSASIWQSKKWADEWGDEKYLERDDGIYEGDEKVADNWREIAMPHREILAQIGELEVWNGGTEGLMEEFLERYSEHVNGITFVGDASGGSRHTSSDTTDWEIIRGFLKDIPNTNVIEGLRANHDYKKGTVKYSNPSVRNSINLVNRYLMDGQDRAHICFMPKSEYESGGVSRSVSSMSLTADGRIDKKPDRQEGKEVARSHFGDTVRYVVVHHNGGESMQSTEEYEESVKSTLKGASVATSEFSGGVFG